MLNKIFRKSEKQLLKYLSTLLTTEYGYNTDSTNVLTTPNYIYAKGNIPIMLIAHLDTVHKNLPKEIYHDQVKNIIWSPQGIGADDRAGVYAILQLISPKVKPHILFTTQEEVGGIGASIAANEIQAPDIKFIIELDRKGADDAVFYDCYNQDFIKYITSFGFIENQGSFSDISHICPVWNIAGVNLSTGYYNQHTKQEYLNLNELNATIKKVKKIFNSLPTETFTFESNNPLDDQFYFEGETFICDHCTEEQYKINESGVKNLCYDCYRYLTLKEVNTFEC